MFLIALAEKKSERKKSSFMYITETPISDNSSTGEKKNTPSKKEPSFLPSFLYLRITSQ